MTDPYQKTATRPEPASQSSKKGTAGKPQTQSYFRRIHPLTDYSNEENPEEEATEAFTLSQADQINLIEKTGILSRIPMSKPSQVPREARKPLLEFSEHKIDQTTTTEADNSSSDQEELESDTLPLWVDRAFDTFLYAVPFSTIFVCLDVAIHSQYGQKVTFNSELKRLANVAPSLVLLIHFTLHQPAHLFTRFVLFSLSTIGGSYMIYAMNKLSYLSVMKQTPALGTLWIYSVVRMDLWSAVISLCLVAAWYRYKNLTLMV